MSIQMQPPPRYSHEFNAAWRDWLYYMWRQTKGGEEGQTGGGDQNAYHKNVDSEILGTSEKTTPIGSDVLLLEDSAGTYSKKRIQFTNLRAAVLTFGDNDKILFGDAGDGSIYYDGTNLVINPKETGTGYLDVQGTIAVTGVIEEVNTTTKTANYTVVGTDDNILCDTSGGGFTVTLPASPEDGRVYSVLLDVAGNDITVDGNGNNINGSTTAVWGSVGAIILVYNGTQWNIR